MFQDFGSTRGRPNFCNRNRIAEILFNESTWASNCRFSIRSSLCLISASPIRYPWLKTTPFCQAYKYIATRNKITMCQNSNPCFFFLRIKLTLFHPAYIFTAPRNFALRLAGLAIISSRCGRTGFLVITLNCSFCFKKFLTIRSSREW